MLQVQMVLFSVVAVVSLVLLRTASTWSPAWTPCEERIARLVGETPPYAEEVRVYVPAKPAEWFEVPTAEESREGALPDFCLFFLAEALAPVKVKRVEGRCPPPQEAPVKGVYWINNCAP